MAAIEAGIITASTKSRLIELEAERARLERGIAQQLISEPQIDKEQIIYFLTSLRSGDTDDDMYKIFLIDTFLNSAYLYDDNKLVLVLNYTGEHNKVTLKLLQNAPKSDFYCSSFAPFGAPNPLVLTKGFFLCSYSLAFFAFWVYNNLNIFFDCLHKEVDLICHSANYDPERRVFC